MNAPKGASSDKKSQKIIDSAQRALKIESQAVLDLVGRIDASFRVCVMCGMHCAQSTHVTKQKFCGAEHAPFFNIVKNPQNL